MKGKRIAGLEIKDVILEIDDSPIHSASRLLEIIASHKPGDELDVGCCAALLLPHPLNNGGGCYLSFSEGMAQEAGA